MRAISLHEPWGTAIARLLKEYETRHWATDYRGPLAIHCAKTKDYANAIFDPYTGPYFRQAGISSIADLNFGKVVAIVQIVSCDPTEVLLRRGSISDQEAVFGNYETRRFGWKLEDVRRLARPFDFRGHQSFFKVPDAMLVAAA